MQKYAERPVVSEEERRGLLRYPKLMQELLHARSIRHETEAEAFLNPDYDLHLHDPFLMRDMERAVDRLLSAVRTGEHIVIYSDYDCDGIPGGVLLHDFLTEIGYKNFSNYIPHRHEEGYGLNVSAIEELGAKGAALLITVDCGITDVEPVERAQALGIDVIITDHHLPNGLLPPAYAVLDPKQEDDSYPNAMLCGSGVAFKLVEGVLARERFGLKKGREKWLLDMVGLATIADMVPLVGENRALAYFGLTVLRKSPRPGLHALCRKMRVNQAHLTEDDVGFMIAPRINAASRMDEPMEAFRLLATREDEEASLRAEHLHKINNERKGAVAAMTREIKKRIRERGELQEVLVVGDPRWRPALLGLAANSLAEEYRRPVFLWGREGGDAIKGSCRSDGSVDVVALMAETGKLFDESGGHEFAGGFSIVHEKVHLLEKTLVDTYRRVRKETAAKTDLTIDRKLSLDDVTWETYALLEKLAPFGEGNPKPIFLFLDIEIRRVRQFGRDNAHLELTFENAKGKNIPAVKFFSELAAEEVLEEGKRVNLVASLEKSMFRNYPELRLRIVGLRGAH